MQRTTRASHSDWVVLPCVWGSCARGLGIFCGRARSNGSGERSHKTHMQSTSDPHKHTGVYRQASRTHGRTCLASPGPVKPTSERGGVSDNPTDRPTEGGRASSVAAAAKEHSTSTAAAAESSSHGGADADNTGPGGPAPAGGGGGGRVRCICWCGVWDVVSFCGAEGRGGGVWRHTHPNPHAARMPESPD